MNEPGKASVAAAVETSSGAVTEPDRPDTPPSSRIWLWVVVAFVVQIAVWSTWFVIAKGHPVQDVPLYREETP